MLVNAFELLLGVVQKVHDARRRAELEIVLKEVKRALLADEYMVEPLSYLKQSAL